MTGDIKLIIDYLKTAHNYDFSGYHSSALESGLQKRLDAVQISGISDYVEFLSQHNDEIIKLIDSLTIHVSRFFRNPLTYNYIENIVLPQIMRNRASIGSNSLRIWSAGCSTGEEPYSMAIIIQEFLENNNQSVQLNIFATDIDPQILSKAKSAEYSFDDIKNMRIGLVKRYFTEKGSVYKLRSSIKNMVDFSVFDLSDKQSKAPPSSIYGEFDLVLCRNVLIYFQDYYQDVIFKKLYQSLIHGGYLVLGEAETIPVKYKNSLSRLNDHSQIYQVNKNS